MRFSWQSAVFLLVIGFIIGWSANTEWWHWKYQILYSSHGYYGYHAHVIYGY